MNQPTLTTGNLPKFYQRTDGNPFVGYNYYRLKLTYLDGSEDYSEIKQITISDIEDFGLFPNPAQEAVKVSLRGYEGKDIQIQLINQFGKSVKIMNIDNVSDSVYNVGLNNVRNGMYSLWIFAEGRKAIGKKVIVNKMY